MDLSDKVITLDSSLKTSRNSSLNDTLRDELITKGRIWNEDVSTVARPIMASYLVEKSTSGLSELEWSDLDVTEWEMPDWDFSGFDSQKYKLPEFGDALRFTSQVTREFGALSGDLLEAAGVVGMASDFVQEAGGAFLNYRYTGDLSSFPSDFASGISGIVPDDWRLWTSSAVRTAVTGAMVSSYQMGQPPIDAAATMVAAFDKLAADNPPELKPVASDIPSVVFPTAITAEKDKTYTNVPSNIGSFGPIGFEVSQQEIFTLSDFSRKREASFAEHKVVNGKSRLQFTGVGLWELTLKITLSRNWTDPEARIAQLTEVQESGEYYPLVLGGRNFGGFVIVSFSEAIKKFGRNGEIESAEVGLTLREYSGEGAGITQVSRKRSVAAAPVRNVSPVRRLAANNFGGQ
ncbi:MAG: phage tail protein [Desulfovibrio sp.]